MSPSATVSWENFVSSSVIWHHFALPQNSVPVYKCTHRGEINIHIFTTYVHTIVLRCPRIPFLCVYVRKGCRVQGLGLNPGP
jgi:hypothetical protein